MAFNNERCFTRRSVFGEFMISDIFSTDDIQIRELNFVILDFVLPKLKRFREMTTSYPATFEWSMETWLKTLDNMIEEIESSIKEEMINVPLFLKYFNQLWI